LNANTTRVSRNKGGKVVFVSVCVLGGCQIFSFLLENLINLSGLLLSLCSLSESILEFTGHSLHVSHATGACCAATLGLLSPVVLSHLLRGISARRAGRLLDVVGNLSASTAQCVRLIMSLSE
jgi:hypothetical protein